VNLSEPPRQPKGGNHELDSRSNGWRGPVGHAMTRTVREVRAFRVGVQSNGRAPALSRPGMAALGRLGVACRGCCEAGAERVRSWCPLGCGVLSRCVPALLTAPCRIGPRLASSAAAARVWLWGCCAVGGAVAVRAPLGRNAFRIWGPVWVSMAFARRPGGVRLCGAWLSGPGAERVRARGGRVGCWLTLSGPYSAAVRRWG